MYNFQTPLHIYNRLAINLAKPINISMHNYFPRNADPIYLLTLLS